MKHPHLKKQVYLVQAAENNYRLDKLFFNKLQPQWTKAFVYKNIRNKNILVNNQRTSNNYHVKTGDQVSFYGFNWQEHTPAKQLDLAQLNNLPPLDVVYEDQHVIIVNKPARIMVQANGIHHYDHMQNRLIKHLNWQFDQGYVPTFVHRLDTNTTGLLIGAKTYQAFKLLSEGLKQGWINKTYDALVWGRIDQPRIVIKNYLVKDPVNNWVQVSHQTNPHAKLAHSEVKLIHNYGECAHVQVRLFTGRTHQIRVHLNYIGHSICGDQKYGRNVLNNHFQYQALVASKLSFADQLCVGILAPLKRQHFHLNNLWFLVDQKIKKTLLNS